MNDEEESVLAALLAKKERERRKQQKEEDARAEIQGAILMEAAKARHAAVNAEIAAMGLDWLLEAKLDTSTWCGCIRPCVVLDMVTVRGSHHHEKADGITYERMLKLRQWVAGLKAIGG